MEIKIFFSHENLIVKTNCLYLYTRRNVKARWKICWGKPPRVEIRVMWPTAGKTVRTRLLKPPWSSHTALAAGHEVKRISPLPWLGFGLAMAWLFLPLTPHCFLHALYYQLFLSASFLFFFHISSILEFLLWLWR